MPTTIPKLCLCLLFFSSTAQAFQPLITDDTGTQGSGGNQLEFSLNHDRTTGAGETVRTVTLPLVYTRGLTESLDAFVGVSHVRIRSSVPGEDASGGGNPGLGLKWRFYDNEASKTSLALKPAIALPVSRAGEVGGRGFGKFSYGLTLILTQELPFGALHANLGVDRNRFRDALANPDATVVRASLAPVWNLGERWKLALDLGVLRERAGGAGTVRRYGELGVIHSPTPDLDFALGIVRQIDNATAKTGSTLATAGVTWRFK